MRISSPFLVSALLLAVGTCAPGTEAADPTARTAPSEPSPTPTIQDVAELELGDFPPLEPRTYFIDPDGELWAEIDRAIVDKAPYIWLVSTSDVGFVSERIGNYQVSTQLGRAPRSALGPLAAGLGLSSDAGLIRNWSTAGQGADRTRRHSAVLA